MRSPFHALKAERYASPLLAALIVGIGRVGQSTIRTMKRRKLTACEKAARKRRRAEFEIIFINGKQERVRRAPTIDGMHVHEYVLRNADPIWLHQNGMWEFIDEPDVAQQTVPADSTDKRHAS